MSGDLVLASAPSIPRPGSPGQRDVPEPVHLPFRQTPRSSLAARPTRAGHGTERSRTSRPSWVLRSGSSPAPLETLGKSGARATRGALASNDLTSLSDLLNGSYSAPPQAIPDDRPPPVCNDEPQTKFEDERRADVGPLPADQASKLSPEATITPTTAATENSAIGRGGLLRAFLA